MSQAAELLWYSTVGNGFKLDKVTGLRAYSTKRYKDHKVPIVWSTDHPGRSNLVLPVRAFCKVCFCTCLMRSEQVCCGFSVAFEMGCFINFHYRLDCMAEPGTRMPGSGWKTQMSWCASIIYYDNNLWSVAHYCYECFFCRTGTIFYSTGTMCYLFCSIEIMTLCPPLITPWSFGLQTFFVRKWQTQFITTIRCWFMFDSG